VVDNGSQDNSVNEINQACPQVVMVRLPKNLGFTGGYNAGIEWSLNIGAQNILLLNNDTIVYPQTLPALLAAPWDVSVPKILNYDDHNKIWAAGCRWRSFPPSVLMIGFGKPDGPEYDRPGPLGFATGCALLCKRRIFETVGGFDPVFESYMEDYDFSYRLIAAGFKMGYVPEARLLHRGSMTLGNTSRSFWRLLGRNTVLFYRKGQRYSKRDLATHLIYISLRETFKGHYSLMSPFWQGIQEGFTLLQSKELK
jgi:GT2 family glycosyltransferase